MPYLRMFLNEQTIDEVFISDHLVQSVIGHSIIAEEKQKLIDKHFNTIKKSDKLPAFCLDAVPSSINSFVSLKEKRV